MKKLINKYGKKKVYIGLATALVVSCAAGIGGIFVYANNKKQAILDSIYIKFIESPTVEYGAESVDYQSFILESAGEVILPIEAIDTKELGLKELVYKISQQGYEKEQKVTIEVKDTQAPIITFKEETITIEVGGELDLKSNVESVIDPVDGVIEEYEVIHNLDNNAAGEYTVTIKATDKNGNESSKDYKVIVKEKEVVDQPVSNIQGSGNTNSNYSGGYAPSKPNTRPNTPSSGGSSSGSNSKPSNSNSTNNDITCTIPPGQYGNSGKIFPTREEAKSWADSQVHAGKYFGYWIGKSHNTCGEVIGWTIDFY